MKYLLAAEVTADKQHNAVVVFTDTRLFFATLIDGMTGLPLVFDTHTECESALALMPDEYELIPVHHMVLSAYPKKSAFATLQHRYSLQPS